MTGISGWWGPISSDCPPSGVLDAMMSVAVPPAGMTAETVAADADRGLAVTGWTGWVSVLRDDGLDCAVYGVPRWSDPRLREVAGDRGHAAALAEAWREKGISLFDAFGGPVSFALVDRKRHEVLAAVDRAGIHQMCFSRTASGLVFASDARAVIAHPGVSAEISRQGLFNFLYFYMSPAPGTVFADVEKLPAGHYVHWSGGTAAVGSYWEIPYRQTTDAEAAELAAEARQVLERAVGAAVDAAGDTAVGAFLSGGLDSTTVAGLLAARKPGATAFTIAFPEERYNELPWAVAGAEHFGLKHVVHELTPAETLDAVPAIVAAHDEPFGNSSAVPAFVCATLARKAGVDTLLAGDGGDEIFGGNERYLQQSDYAAWRKLPAAARGAGLAVLGLLADRSGRGPLSRIRIAAERASMPLPDRLQAYNPLETEPLADIFEPAFLDGIDSAAPRGLLRTLFHAPSDASDLQRMLYLDRQVTLADNDLRKVNRACEAAGIRVGYPMLDETLVAFAAALPDEIMLRDGALRGFFKEAMQGFLPDVILRKQKHGFGMPFAEWLRAPGPLRDMAIGALESFSTRGILAPGLVADLRSELSGGDGGRFGGMVWDVMMLEHWLEANSTGVSFR